MDKIKDRLANIVGNGHEIVLMWDYKDEETKRFDVEWFIDDVREQLNEIEKELKE